MSDAGSFPDLVQAAKNGEIEDIKRLLLNGADPTVEDENGRSAVYYASINGHAAAASLLLQCAKIQLEVRRAAIGQDRTYASLMSQAIAQYPFSSSVPIERPPLPEDEEEFKLDEREETLRTDELEQQSREWMARRDLKPAFAFTRAQRQELKKWFDFLDADHSGEIDLEELEDPLLSTGIASSRKELEALLARVDSDQSGEIGFEEFLAVLKPGGTGRAASRSSASNIDAFHQLQQLLDAKERPLGLPLLLAEQRRNFLLQSILLLLSGEDERLENEDAREEEEAIRQQDTKRLIKIRHRSRNRAMEKAKRVARLKALQEVVHRQHWDQEFMQDIMGKQNGLIGSDTRQAVQESGFVNSSQPLPSTVEAIDRLVREANERDAAQKASTRPLSRTKSIKSRPGSKNRRGTFLRKLSSKGFDLSSLASSHQLRGISPLSRHSSPTHPASRSTALGSLTEEDASPRLGIRGTSPPRGNLGLTPRRSRGSPREHNSSRASDGMPLGRAQMRRTSSLHRLEIAKRQHAFKMDEAMERRLNARVNRYLRKVNLGTGMKYNPKAAQTAAVKAVKNTVEDSQSQSATGWGLFNESAPDAVAEESEDSRLHPFLLLRREGGSPLKRTGLRSLNKPIKFESTKPDKVLELSGVFTVK